MHPKTLVTTIGAVFATAALGGLASRPAESIWYSGLTKPSFQPPRQAFPIVWPMLYADIAAVSASTVVNTQASKNCNIQPYGDTLPQSVRQNALMRFNQNFSDRLTASVMMDYNELVVTTRSQPGQITTNTTAFGPASGKGGQINPFYQAPAGSPQSTASEQVSWVDLMGRGLSA